MKHKRSFQERLAKAQAHWRVQANLQKAREDKAKELARSRAASDRKRARLLMRQAKMRVRIEAEKTAKKAAAKARSAEHEPQPTPSIVSRASALRELKLARARFRYGVKHNILDVGPLTKRQHRFETESWKHWLSQHPRNKPKYHDIWTVYWEDTHPRWLQSQRAVG